MYNLEKVLIDRGLGATPQMLRDAYLDKLDCLKDWTLMTLIEVHMAELRSKIGKSIAKRTVKNYEYGARFIRDYMRSQYQDDDIPIPNTNNILEAINTDLKTKLRVHNGMSKRYRKLFIDEYFRLKWK